MKRLNKSIAKSQTEPNSLSSPIGVHARAITRMGLALAMLIGASVAQARPAKEKTAEPLQLLVYTSSDDAYDVTSTLIYGKTEAILVDAQFWQSDAAKLADQIAATGRTLKAIFITHPDLDHYIGIGVLHERFPKAAILMTPAGLEDFKRNVAATLVRQKKNKPTETPDSLPTPEVLSSDHFSVDGQRVEVIADVQGDVPEEPSNSFLWIPSLRSAIAGDIVFNGVHPWLKDSNPTRLAWLGTLDRLASFHPLTVVAGHRKTGDQSNSPEAVKFMKQYLTDFDSQTKKTADADALVAAMKQNYPGLAQERFLVIAAKSAFKK